VTPLDAARLIAAAVPTYGHPITENICPCLIEHHEDCHYCDAPLKGPNLEKLGDHASYCPWLGMPKIVAVMEAAQAAVEEWGHPNRCPFCGPRLQLRPTANHESVCPWVALAKALKG
jgi:hypothetical protein